MREYYDWKSLIQRVTFKTPIRGRFVYREPDHDSALMPVSVTFCMKVQDVNTGTPTEVNYTKMLPRMIQSDHDATRYLWHIALSALEHELAECMLLDGRHVRDPHPESKR